MASLQDYRELFAGQVGRDQVDALLAHGQLVELSQGEILLKDQASVSAMYLLLDGQVGLSVEVAGHSIHMGRLEPGNWVGEVAYFSGSHTSCSTVTAQTEARFFRLGFAEFSAFTQAAPEAACRMTHILVTMLIHRLRVTAQNPMLDSEGQLLLPVDLSLPHGAHVDHEHGVIGLIRKFFGGR